MNSKQLYTLIETIAAASKKTDKERLLREADCPELREILVATYDPTLNYYIKKIPSVVNGDKNFCDSGRELLWALSSRRVTGHEAQNALAQYLGTLNIESKELLTRIIRRDLRAGFSVATINKVFPKLLKEVPYMRCSLLSKVDTSKWDWSEGHISQIKMDGMFCNLTVTDDGYVSLTSRQGSEFPSEEFVDTIENNFERGYQYHGELLIVKFDGTVLPREIGNGILNSVLKGGSIPAQHYPKFVAWDMVELDVIQGELKSTKPYVDRFKQLCSIPKSESFDTVETKRVFSLEQAFEHYRDALSRGLEGTIIKNKDALWRDGTSREQLKLKLEVDVDLEIIGFTRGNGKNADTFGSVETATRDRLLKVDVSGFSDEMRLYIHLHRDELLGTIMTVRGNEIMYGRVASLFLPRFCELRGDKTVADSFAEVVEQFENAKKGIK